MPVEIGSTPAIVITSAIRPLLERIRVVYDPRQLWLFGSRARGDAREDSDWDLLAVVDDATPDRLFDPEVMWRLLDLERYPAELCSFHAVNSSKTRTRPTRWPTR